MYGLFDGAGDLDLKDAGHYDDSSSDVPHANCAESEFNADDERYDSPIQYSNVYHDTLSQNLESLDHPADQNFMPPFGLDGHDYEYPRSI